MTDYSLMGYETIKVDELIPLIDSICSDLQFIHEESDNIKESLQPKCSLSIERIDSATTAVSEEDKNVQHANYGSNLVNMEEVSGDFETIETKHNNESLIELKNQHISKINEQLSDKTGKISQLEMELEQVREELNNMISRNEMLVQNKRKELKIKNDKLHESDLIKEELESKCNMATRTIEKLNKKIKDLENEYKDIEAKNEELEAKLDQKTKEVKNLKRGTKFNEDLSEDYKLKFNNLENDKKSLIETINRQSREIDELKAKVDDLTDENNKLNGLIQEKDKKIILKNDALENLKKKLQTPSDDEKSMKLELRNLKMEYDQMHIKIEELNKAYQKAEDDCEKEKAEKNSYKTKLEEMSKLTMKDTPKYNASGIPQPEWWKLHIFENVTECPACSGVFNTDDISHHFDICVMANAN